jgi:hypothetical protein
MKAASSGLSLKESIVDDNEPAGIKGDFTQIHFDEKPNDLLSPSYHTSTAHPIGDLMVLS